MKKTFMAISMLVFAASSFAAEKNSYKLNCKGTEPFWSVSIEQQAITYKPQLDQKGIGYYDAKKSESEGVSPGYAFQIEASREKGKKKVSLSIIAAGENSCNDGMSDETYKYHVLANIDGRVVYGCCK